MLRHSPTSPNAPQQCPLSFPTFHRPRSAVRRGAVLPHSRVPGSLTTAARPGGPERAAHAVPHVHLLTRVSRCGHAALTQSCVLPPRLGTCLRAWCGSAPGQDSPRLAPPRAHPHRDDGRPLWHLQLLRINPRLSDTRTDARSIERTRTQLCRPWSQPSRAGRRSPISSDGRAGTAPPTRGVSGEGSRHRRNVQVLFYLHCLAA